MTPLVSVIVCSYNQASFLLDATESVLHQTYPNVELVIIDNGSTDESHELLQKYAREKRVRLLLYKKNEPVTKRLNQGIAASTGNYISILYADDYYLPNKLERQIECFLKLPSDYGVVYSPGYRLNILNGKQWFDPSLEVSGYILKDLLLDHSKGFVNPISPLVRRECFERYTYDENLFVEGESINLRFAMAFKFYYLSEPLVVMRDHDNNIGKAIKSNVERLMVVLDKLKMHEDFPKKHQRNVEIFRARILRDCGWQGLRIVGDAQWARGYFKRSIRTNWTQAIHPRIVLGVCLSLLPRKGLTFLNKVTNQLLRRKSNMGYLDKPELEVH